MALCHNEAILILEMRRMANGMIEKRSATDSVSLGSSGEMICRQGVGTGSDGGKVQRDLSREGFNQLIRHGENHAGILTLLRRLRNSSRYGYEFSEKENLHDHASRLHGSLDFQLETCCKFDEGGLSQLV